MICMNASKVYNVLWVYSVMTNYCSERLEEAFVCINFLSKKPFHTCGTAGVCLFACQIFKKIRMKRPKLSQTSTSNNEKCIIAAQE